MFRIVFLILIFFNVLFSDVVKVEFNWKHQFEFAGFYAALQKGYYKDAGLDVELIERDISIPHGQKCLNKEVQFFISYSSVISEIQNKKPYVMVANYLKRSPLALAVKKDILLPKDLKNKTIMASIEEMQSAGFRKMFLENGIKKSDYKFVQNSMELEEFRQGRADAISIYLTNEPYFLRKNKTPFVIMDPSHYGGDLLYDLNLLTTKTYAKEHPDTVKKFVEATNKGWKYALSHKEEIIDLILKKYNTQQKSKEHLLFEADEIEKLMEPDGYEIGSIDLKRVKKIEELYIRLGDAKEFIEPKEFVLSPKYNDILTSEERTWLNAHLNIVLGTDHSWPPFDMTLSNGKHYGFHSDLIEAINKKLGSNIKIEAGQWADIQEKAKKGEIAGLLGPAITPERLKYLVFSNPYFDSINAVFFAKKKIKKISDLKEFQKLTIAVPKGFGFLNQTKKEIPGLRFVEYDGAEKTIEAMLLEKVDAALTDYTAGSYLVQQRGATDVHIVYVPKFEKNMTVQIGIKKEWKILRDIFNKALSEIQNDELAKLQKKWFRVEVPYSTFNKTISLTQKEKDFIKEHSDITFGVDANWAPYIIVGEDGKLSGYEIDMLKKIKSLTGLNINIKVGQWSDMVAQAKERKIDGLTTSAYNKEREDFFLFSTLYNKVRYMAAVAPGNPHNIKHINDLKNKTIATQKSNLMMIKIAKKLSNKKPLLANSVTDAYNMIVRDEAQATIATEELWYWIKEKDYRHILPAFSLPEYVGLLYSIRKDWPELKSILDKAINVIPENEKRALKNKWLLIQGPTENSPQIDEGKKIVLNEEEKDWLSKHHTVKVRIVDWAPYTFKYPKPSGISIDYLHYVTKKHGIALDFVSGDNFTWPEVMNDLEKENKFFDLTPLMKRTPEREAKFALSDDYVFTPWVIIAKKDRIDITGIDSLKGKTVAVEKGYAIQKRLQQEYPEIKFHEVHWPKEALEAVATGVADGYVGNLANSTYLIRKNGLTNLNVVASSPFGYHSQAMAIRPDWPELASIINKTLKTMSQEEHNAILDKWIHTKDTGSDTQISNSLYLNSSEKNFLKKHGEIQLCADSVWTPIDYIDEDGKYSGVGAEFIQLFSQKIGKKIVNYPAKNWQEVLDAAKEGKCDVVSMIAKTPSRAKYLSFTTPYFSSQNVVVTGEDVSYIEDLSKFTNENFGIIRGFASIELLKKKYPGINLIEVGSVKEGLIKVADKEIFGFIDIIPTIAWHIQKLGLIHLKISGDTGVPLQLGLGVKKEFHELHDIFQKAVDSLTPSEKEMILNRYINVRYEKGFDYTMLYKLLFIGVVLFLFILYHTLQKEKLNKELKQKVKEEVEKSRQKDNMIFHQNKLVSMGEMIENIAHQWRQPLSQINASVLVIDDAMMEKDFESEEIEKELDDIERMTKYMSHTIDDFRSLFAKDKIKENLDLREVIGTAVSIINSSLKYHRINLTVKNSARNIVQGYKNDLIQVILVILNNAKDVLIQTKKDDPKIVIQTTCDDTMVKLKICDNGGGISEENLDKIFEPYFTTKHKAQGTGLGLYISKIIIEQGMEGKLKVENTKEGACFNIELKKVDNE